MTAFEYLVAIALLLFVLDLFFQFDFGILVSFVLLSFALTLKIDLHYLYEMSIGLVLFILITAAYYLFFRRYMELFNNKFIAKTRYVENSELLVGKSGVIEVVEGKVFIRVDGQLWDFESALSNEELVGSNKIIEKYSNGIITLED